MEGAIKAFKSAWREASLSTKTLIALCYVGLIGFIVTMGILTFAMLKVIIAGAN